MNLIHRTKLMLAIAVAIYAIVATTAPGAAACGSGIAVSDISNIAWMENPFPRASPAVYVELERWAELSRTGPMYGGVRYVYTRPRRVERPEDAAAVFAVASRIVMDAEFFALDPRRGPLGLDSIYRTISAKRCSTIVQFEFSPGDDPRLNALFAKLTELARGAAWSPASGEPPARIPVFHLPTEQPAP